MGTAPLSIADGERLWVSVADSARVADWRRRTIQAIGDVNCATAESSLAARRLQGTMSRRAFTTEPTERTEKSRGGGKRPRAAA